ncbi:MAG: M42 family metallopeptidase [Gemmatimonadota bacterium]|jgi:putative aminopeptidase FrvX|nr:M42 family metallopeptidase [Gemmatimonadota bacterium]MDQ8151183.1 M42 family metallopeptidase [Gemmatimonadota bacterium]MDQ8152293.1 M42 family metallopeptidase [Gemmatimonadota bacterium]MDQ8170337.1 M42 family metallopeptidase [Gemmatimonadota bacterium]MDQ8175338.1 M42 family metallopeptidase [Gemmatimonadota bacterium]
MLDASAITFLKRLLDTPGPSGYEGPAAAVWREEAKGFAAEVHADVAGNSMAVVNPNGGPTIMLAGHIDEIGVIVTHIDDEGYVHIGPIGGWDPQVLVAQRIRFLGRAGEVLGAVGKKPIHLMKPEDREKAAKMTDLWVDIGASSKAEAAALLSVGDAGVIDSRTVDFPNRRIVSRSIDDRIGAFVVLEALRRYAADPGEARVVAVATTQEEIGYQGGGARVAGERVDPAMAIVVDVTFATDHPGLEKKELGEAHIGGGPVLTRGSVVSPVAFGILRDAAESLAIPHTLRAEGRQTFTDADAIHLARHGVATALVSVPNRYMHSPNELVSLDDLDHAATLIAAACRSVTARTDFTAR